MKKSLIALFGAAALSAGPAQAATVVAGAAPVLFDAFTGDYGTRIAVRQDTVSALNFRALFRSAVYRTAGGTLDFWYQVERLGRGTLRDREITKFNVQDIEGVTVDALRINVDPDGGGIFTTGFNPTPAGGSTTNVSRSPDGSVVETNFWGTGFNGLVGTERSVIYVLRTNATAFTEGTFGVLGGGSGGEGLTFAPLAVPEPATWAMMIGGFCLLGAAVRRNRRVAPTFA